MIWYYSYDSNMRILSIIQEPGINFSWIHTYWIISYNTKKYCTVYVSILALLYLVSTDVIKFRPQQNKWLWITNTTILYFWLLNHKFFLTLHERYKGPLWSIIISPFPLGVRIQFRTRQKWGSWPANLRKVDNSNQM